MGRTALLKVVDDGDTKNPKNADDAMRLMMPMTSSAVLEAVAGNWR